MRGEATLRMFAEVIFLRHRALDILLATLRMNPGMSISSAGVDAGRVGSTGSALQGGSAALERRREAGEASANALASDGGSGNRSRL